MPNISLYTNHDADPALVLPIRLTGAIGELTLLESFISDYAFTGTITPEGKLEALQGIKLLAHILSMDDVRATTLFDIVHLEDRASLKKSFLQLQKNRPISVEFRVHDSSTDSLWVRASCYPVWSDHEQRVTSIAGLMVDITHQKSVEATLAYLVGHDALTHVLNHHAFETILTESLAAATTLQVPCTLLRIHLDRFTQVNDSLGSTIGDQVLLIITRYLKTLANTYAGTLARLDSKEFAMLLLGVPEAQAHQVSNTILAYLDNPMTIGPYELRVPASIGMACFDKSTPTPALLMMQADIALQRAKRQGGGVAAYQPESDTIILPVTLESELRHALATSDPTLSVVYQNITDLQTGKVFAMETLFRWDNNKRVTTEQVITLAETTGLVEAIDRWVMTRAFSEGHTWLKPGMSLALNLSVYTLRNLTLVPFVQELIQQYRISPRQIIFEVTETAWMEEIQSVRDTLITLRDLGCRIYLDDFGSRYATFARIKQLPLDGIKIDRQFVAGIGKNRYDEAILAGIATFAHAVEIPLIAEGVETQAQMKWLAQKGFQGVQGYYLGYPSRIPAMAVPV
jgi:diguanylate cyclase (GGDEF)-like protein